METEIWQSDNGHSPAGEFIERLDPKAQKKIVWMIGQLESRGLALLKSEDLKKLSGYSIYELRIRLKKQSYRLMGVIRKSKFYMLHGFIKKSRETPLKEIRLTLNREKELDIQLNKIKLPNQ